MARLLGEVEALPLEPLDRARVTWIRESFDDGVAGGRPAARALANVAEQTLAEDAALAINLLGGAALRCWWGDPGLAVRDRVIDGRRPAPARRRRRPADGDPGLGRPGATRAPEVIERLSELLPDPHGDGRAMRLYGMAATAVGHQELAAGFLGAAVAGLRADGRLALLSQALVLRAWSGLHLGSWHASMPDLEEGGRLAAETSQPLWQARARAGEAASPGCAGSPTSRRGWRPRSSASRCPRTRAPRSPTSSTRAGSPRSAPATTPTRTTSCGVCSTAATPPTTT